LKKPYLKGKYEGEYSYEIMGKKFSERINGRIPPPNEKEVKLSRELIKLNPDEGRITARVSHPDLFERNGKFFEIIPPFKKADFEFHLFRGEDNTFKANIINSFSKNIILKYADLDELKRRVNHPNHEIVVSWKDGRDNLFIDKILVDPSTKK
jgi:hypothetical protein